MRTGGWGPALRIAWRTARHYRGRTALVAVLVALPVLVGGFVDVVARTSQLPAEERVRRFMGSAEAYVQVSWCSPPITEVVYYDGVPSVAGENCQERPADERVNVQELLPPGSMVAAAYPSFEQFARVRHGKQSVRIVLWDQPDVGSPLREGMVHLRSGRMPAATGEVMATTTALEQLHADVGDSVTVDSGSSVAIVGEFVDPGQLNTEALVGLPGWTGLASDSLLGLKQAASFEAFLVNLPDGTDPVALQRELLDDGVLLAPRQHVLDPPQHQQAESGGRIDPQMLAAPMLIVGVGMVEVILLAGTAFAVAARRQVRDLGLVAAIGGEARHIRRVVLAQGVVIGLIGAGFAIPLAVAAVFFGRPWLDRMNNSLMGPLDVRPLELAALVVLGLMSGLAAALVPAFTAARLPVLDALNKRFKSTSLRARWPRIGLAMLILGVGISGIGAMMWRNSQVDYREHVAQLTEQQRISITVPDGLYAEPSNAPYPTGASNAFELGLMLLGFALVAFGLALNAPALVAAVAKLGRWLPLSARFALRDAGRHRHRTGPAVAAIMTAVAGSVALSFYVLSADTRDERNYVSGLRYGQVHVLPAGVIDSEGAIDSERFIDTVERIGAGLPTESVVPIRVAHLEGTDLDPELKLDSVFATCWEPDGDAVYCQTSARLGVGGRAELSLLGDVPDEAIDALEQGKAVVTDSHYTRDGEVTLVALEDLDDKRPPTLTIPAVVIPMAEAMQLPAVWISPETATSRGLAWSLSSAVIDTTRAPTREEEERAAEALEEEGDDAFLIVERGHQSDASVVILVLVGGSAFVTLVGTAIAVALAAAESRADHATLLAVGAEPRRRRLLAMGQAGTVSTLGVGLGVILGAIIGSAVLGGNEELPFVVPWVTLAEIAIVIPLVGVLIAGLFTRSRLPLERRIT